MISFTLFLLIRFAYIAIDAVCIFISILCACWLRQTAFPVSLRDLLLDTTHPFYHVFVLWMATVLFFNGLFHLYQTRREVVESHEIWSVIRSVSLAALAVLVFVFSMKVEGFPRSVFLLMGTFTTILLCVWRVLKRLFVEFLAANGYNNFNVLIVGAGKIGMMLAEEIKRHPGFGFRIIGFLDDHKTSQDLAGKYKVLGKLADIHIVIQRYFISKVFMTINPGGGIFHNMLEVIKQHNISVSSVPEAFDRATGDLFKYNIGFIPILEYSDLGQHRRQYGKRFFDYSVAGLALVLLLPFFMVIAILIVKDSPGPVFHFSRRYGKGGKTFNMWKFRSMVADAEQKLQALKEKNEVDGPIFKIRRDPRVTTFGKVLRKYSLDELPQLVNVFLGDMSLVGPRPLPIDQVEHNDLAQLKRLQVRPGITGLWQVRGRSDLSFHQLIKWDAWYINNWSFMLDLNILFETIPVVFKGKGAY